MAAITIPTSPEELAETLSDNTKLKAIFEDGQIGQFIKNYTDANQKADPELATQVRDEVQRVTAQFLRDNKIEGNGKNLHPGKGAKDRAAGYNDEAPGAAIDNADIFRNHTEYLRAVWHGNSTDDARSAKYKLRNDFGTVVPGDGGYLVPESFRADMLSTSVENSVVRPRATVIPMDTQRVSFPTVEDTNHAGPLFGGMVAYWTEEAAALQKSSAKFGKVTLDSNKLTGKSVVPNELFADAARSFGGFLGQTWPTVLTYTEDGAFFDGNGTGQPLGFLHTGNAAAVTVAKESGQADATIVWDNIVKMYSRMLPSSINNSAWIVNQECFPQLAKMSLDVGTGGSAIWLNNGVSGPPMTMLGRPVVLTEKANALGARGDVSFVDLSFYLIGDRQAMQMATSEHEEFSTDQTVVRIIQRLDGRPWLNNAITPKKGSATVSPFVVLGARTS